MAVELSLIDAVTHHLPRTGRVFSAGAEERLAFKLNSESGSTLGDLNPLRNFSWIALSSSRIASEIARISSTVSRSFINLVEMEKRKPTYEIVLGIANELGINQKEALRAAYLARQDFDKKREAEYLSRLIEKKKIKDIEVRDIIK